MEITCQRCKTEYEFDDALISERGTTVRCTSCGEQFKVFRSEAATAQPERWVVTHSSGREIAFTTLKDLQRAIAGRQVGRNDLLTRGNGPSRPLGSIPELEPFFAARLALPHQRPPGLSSPPRPASTGTTGPSDAALAATPAAAPAATMAFELSAPGGVPVRTGRTDPPPPMIVGPQVHPGKVAPAPIPQSPRIAPIPVPVFQEDGAFAQTVGVAPRSNSHQAPELPSPDAWEPPQAPRDAPPSATYNAVPYPPPPPPRVAQHAAPQNSFRPTEQNPDWFDEPRFTPVDGHRSRGLRWLVALLLLGLLGFFAAAFSKKYMPALKATVASWSGSSATSAPEGEARVAAFLQEGEHALTDGDLDAAKEAFDKASAFAERDPHVLTDLAHLANVRADIYWLRARLLPADQPDVVRAATVQLHESAERAVKAANKAIEVAPSDPETVRTKIDALRLSAEAGAARQLVGQVTSIASQPETAYVLAALDLADEGSNLAPTIDRLRIAAATERAPMRASSALVYALARSGDVAGARAEVDKLAAARRPPQLLAELNAFVGQKAGALVELDAGKRAGADAGTAARSAAAAAATTAQAGQDDTSRGRATEDDTAASGGDYRSQLKQAAQASASGQYDRADQLFRAALASNPGDTEALTGLGDVSRARGHVDQARSFYEQALSANPHYLPAESALADIRWDTGDKNGAGKLYRDVLENSSTGPYADKAKRRLAELDPNRGAPLHTVTTVTTGPIPSPPKKSPSAPTAAPPTDLAPEIDTSDLPGFHR